MKVIHSDQPLEVRGYSIFLAGPTPRQDDVQSWRPEAINILKSFGYRGTILVPERRDWKVKFDYVDQVEWEYKGLSIATALVFWVPRKMDGMPALTTNVEFGLWLTKRPHDVVYGRPPEAEHCRYLDWLFSKQTHRKPVDNLTSVLKEAALHV